MMDNQRVHDKLKWVVLGVIAISTTFMGWVVVMVYNFVATTFGV